MDFSLTEDQESIREMARDFARNEIAPGVIERDREGAYPTEIIAAAGELGFCGMTIPEEYGGSELDTLSYCLVLEELARECPSTSVTLSVTNSVCAQPIVRFGSDEQKAAYLPKLATGEWIGGFMLTEPDSGSDAKGMRTRAVRDGDDWVLNGSKAWVTNAQVGKIFVVMARTADDEITAFLVEDGTPGLAIERMEDKMGLRSSKTAMYSFTDVRLPQSAMLGGQGDGMKVALGSLDSGRLGIASQGLGMGCSALAEAARYANDRVAFGRPIGKFQAIQWMLADMHAELEGARLLLYRAALLSAEGRLDPATASMAKLTCTESAKRACDAAVQIHGGNGYSREYKVERLFRDVRVTTIYEGTSQIQKMVIGRSLLK